MLVIVVAKHRKKDAFLQLNACLMICQVVGSFMDRMEYASMKERFPV